MVEVDGALAVVEVDNFQRSLTINTSMTVSTVADGLSAALIKNTELA